MNLFRKLTACVCAVCMMTGAVFQMENSIPEVTAEENIESTYDWGTLKIGGGGFVSAIVTGQKNMFARTDVGGAYKYNYDTETWEQLFEFINDTDRGYLGVGGIAVDPTDDDTVYFICGSAYFSDARTVIFKTTDGGETFTKTEVTDLIQIHGTGDGRQCGEPIAVDPDNPDVIYAGGDVTGGDSCLIKSIDGGKTWKPVAGYDALGLYTNEIKWPTWTDHMVRSVEDGEYKTQQGVAAIRILDGKIYVATAVKGKGNIHVADLADDKFELLSEDLPTDNYPLSISYDGSENFYFTYIAGLAFNGTSGGIYKYNIADGKVTDVSPTDNAYGTVYADKNNPDKLVTRTCGLFSPQWYSEEWTEDSVAWGDWFYRSEDGGATWENITPGTKADQYTDNEHFVSLPISTGGYDWIYGKSCHWGSSMVIDPQNPDRVFMTSGNGIFACDNVWDDRDVQFYFHPNGIEEVVALDFVSTPDGLDLSAIGDYDGFQHNAVDEIGIQYKPNMGSTCAISVCPQNTDVRIRIAEGNNDIAAGYYTTDGGKTWIEMDNAPGGHTAITQLEEGKYRFFKSCMDSDKSTAVSYSDDFGKTWETCEGIPTAYGSRGTHMFVEPDAPNVVYAYVTYYNESWIWSKPKPDDADVKYKLCVSTDYGKTFESTDICTYDQCDSAGRIAYLGKPGELILAGGYYGLYHVRVENGKVVVNEKIDGVSYCKTVGYGAPEKAGDPNAVYFYGRTTNDAPEGIYRSTDAGKTWVCINSSKLYGGTGNANFIVGDMDEFGKVYMSTVGCGIVYGVPSGVAEQEKIRGDVNSDGKFSVADILMLQKWLVNTPKATLSDWQAADMCNDGIINVFDLSVMKKELLKNS